MLEVHALLQLLNEPELREKKVPVWLSVSLQDDVHCEFFMPDIRALLHLVNESEIREQKMPWLLSVPMR